MQELIKKMFPSKSIRIIGSGVDLKRDIRHVQNDCFDSIFVGPIHPQKRPLDIVKAFSLIKNEIKHVKLHFIGEIMSNELKKEMEKVAVDNNLKIIFHGTISDEKLYDLYDIADIAIFVPGLQPWGIFPLETILGGIPTIISDECGIIDVLPRDFPIVKTGHINELASKILEIEDNYQEHKNKVIKVKKIISDEYSWESYAKRMFDVYDNCLNTL
jgi:glycosyltransferase involved in cell wall biosynthesis